MKRAASYLSELDLFVGYAHVTEDNDSDMESTTDPSTTSSPPLQHLEHGKIREQDSDKTRDHDSHPCSIPHTDTDFAPIKSKPVS